MASLVVDFITEGDEIMDKYTYPAFDQIAHDIIFYNNILTMDDTKELLLYRDGVYVGHTDIVSTETEIERQIVARYGQLFNEMNHIDMVPAKVPAKKFVSEVLAVIQRNTALRREHIDKLNPHLINLNNGMFDVREWKFIPHDPEYLSIRRIPVAYDPSATCPNIRQFLSQVVSEDDQKFLIEFVGYCLLPDTRMQKAVMLYGVGSNGKSVFLKLVEKLIGSENTSHVNLQQLQEDRDKYSSADLYGKLINIGADLSSEAIRDGSVFKMLTGEDKIRAQRKYQNGFSFLPTTRMIFSANHIPEIKHADMAIMRRWELVNFPHVFEEADQDKDLLKKITSPEELSGFLNLALEGLRKVITARSFSRASTTNETMDQYVMLSNPVVAFVEKYVIRHAASTVDKTTFNRVYRKWEASMGLKPISENMIGRKMKSLDMRDTRENCGAGKISLWIDVAIDMTKLNRDLGLLQPN